MATYQSWPGSDSDGAAGAADVAGPPLPKALSNASPSSRSSAASGAPSAAGLGSAGAGAAAGGRFTATTFPHFLQRTLTPFGPTFSSEIMYCEPQLSQENFMGVPVGSK